MIHALLCAISGVTKPPDALLEYIDDYTAELDKAAVKYIQSACLDFSKASDRLQPSIVLNKMRMYGFNNNIIELISDFVSNRKQCVQFLNSFSDYSNINVGSPQGTKLGPVLWLIYVNDLHVNEFYSLKYADDTTFYTPIRNHVSHDDIATAIIATRIWSDDNSMILNAAKTVVMNA